MPVERRNDWTQIVKWFLAQDNVAPKQAQFCEFDLHILAAVIPDYANLQVISKVWAESARNCCKYFFEHAEYYNVLLQFLEHDNFGSNRRNFVSLASMFWWHSGIMLCNSKAHRMFNVQQPETCANHFFEPSKYHHIFYCIFAWRQFWFKQAQFLKFGLHVLGAFRHNALQQQGTSDV